MVHAGYEGTNHSRLHKPLKRVCIFSPMSPTLITKTYQHDIFRFIPPKKKNQIECFINKDYLFLFIKLYTLLSDQDSFFF